MGHYKKERFFKEEFVICLSFVLSAYTSKTKHHYCRILRGDIFEEKALAYVNVKLLTLCVSHG